MNKNDKTAIKLLGKYADSYKILEEENYCLKSEIKDLRINLKINKEIIEDFYKRTKTDSINSIYIEKLKEEIKNLNVQFDKIFKEKEDLRIKLIYLEQVSNESLEWFKRENDKLNTTNLVLEGQFQNLNSQILLNKKINDKFEKDEYNVINIQKEIFVTDPTLAINLINSELLCYRDAYNKLVNHQSKLKVELNNDEDIMSNQQLEITKLRKTLNDVMTKTATKYVLSNNDELLSHISPKTNENKTIFSSPSKNTIQKTLVHTRNTSNTANMCPIQTIKKLKQSFETEEWLEILRMADITSEEMDRLAKNKKISKIIEAIELLNKLLVDKNLQIRQIDDENGKLNCKNYELNSENIRLINKCEDLISRMNHSNTKKTSDNETNKSHSDSVQSDISSNNNNSKITIKNLKSKSVSKNYETKKLSKKTSNKSIKPIHIRTSDVYDLKSHHSNISRIKKQVLSSNNIDNKLNSKLHLSSKGNLDKNVTPRSSFKNHVRTENNLENEVDYIEVKLNKNLYNDSTRKDKLDAKIESYKTIIGSKKNSPDLNKESVIFANKTNTNSLLFITKVKDDVTSKEEELNDSYLEKSKPNGNTIESNRRNIYECTFGSFTSTDIRKNFLIQNESGFISNANDMENLKIKIQNSKY